MSWHGFGAFRLFITEVEKGVFLGFPFPSADYSMQVHNERCGSSLVCGCPLIAEGVI